MGPDCVNNGGPRRKGLCRACGAASCPPLGEGGGRAGRARGRPPPHAEGAPGHPPPPPPPRLHERHRLDEATVRHVHRRLHLVLQVRPRGGVCWRVCVCAREGVAWTSRGKGAGSGSARPRRAALKPQTAPDPKPRPPGRHLRSATSWMTCCGTRTRRAASARTPAISAALSRRAGSSATRSPAGARAPPPPPPPAPLGVSPGVSLPA